MAIINFSSITFSGIKTEIERFLREQHNKAGILFSPASPFGHILSIMENLHQMSLLYLKNAINQFDLSESNSNNPRIIRNTAILAGHIPTRAISATGTLKLTLKSNIDIGNSIDGSRITLFNRTAIRNVTNSLDYAINIGSETITHKIIPNYSFFLSIIQGRWNVQTFTGTGNALTSYNISELGQRDVENFNFEVIVNGEVWIPKKHLWDMLPDEKSYIAKTGYNGGIDIVFGNGSFGAIPPISSFIVVNYLVTDGGNGNIFRRTRNDWRFIGDVLDGSGNFIDITKYFDIDIYTDINFGADGEDINFTKNILPVASNNFVLGLPQQYAYHIKKLGVFSHVNAYERSGSIFIVATPNIRLFKNRNADYFTIDIRAFELDRYEKSKIDRYLNTSGLIQLTKRYRVDSPKLSYYVINIFVIPYSDATDDSLNNQILDIISEYFLDLRRIDRVPKLDLIRELSTIKDLHSVDLQFVCKKNEDFHRENPNDNTTIGLDNVLGDIIFEPNELPIIRGGWKDRNDIYYSSDINGTQMKSVNIIRKGTVDAKNRNL
jgi:hypothetical protein